MTTRGSAAYGEKPLKIVSVLDYGAVGDGTTDDTAAFTAAIAASANGVYVSPGSYALTGAVTGKFYSFGTVTIVGGTLNGMSSLSFGAPKLTIPPTTSAAVGVLYQSATPILHTYADPSSDGHNTFVGQNAGNFTSTYNAGIDANTGAHNVGFGDSALTSLTTGWANCAFGYTALQYTTTGAHNAGFGDDSLRQNISGSYNTAIGIISMRSNQSGTNNSAVGHQSLDANVSGSYNCAVGSSALKLATGSYNTAVGYLSQGLVVGGDTNTSVGYLAMQNMVSGQYNVAVGTSALLSGLGSRNTAVGDNALLTTTGSNNTACGENAGYAATGNGGVYLGCFAGFYETGAGKFYIDNQTRTNEATNRTNAMMYGVFNATPASQTLALNAVVTPLQLLTTASASGACGFRLPHGAAPSSPVDGDMWTTTAGLFVRINGVTKTVTLT